MQERLFAACERLCEPQFLCRPFAVALKGETGDVCSHLQRLDGMGGEGLSLQHLQVQYTYVCFGPDAELSCAYS